MLKARSTCCSLFWFHGTHCSTPSSLDWGRYNLVIGCRMDENEIMDLIGNE